MEVLKTTEFAWNFWHSLGKHDENGLLSPISILSAFSMLLVGAKSQTALDLKKALHVDTSINDDTYHHAFATYIESINKVANDEENELKVSLANRIFLQKDFKLEKHFVDVLQKSYFANIGEVNFSDAAGSASTINSWVEMKTNHKIKDLIQADSLDKDTRLVLVNAIHFKGKWEQTFKSFLTKKEAFHLLNGSTKEVSMMSKEDYLRALDDSTSVAVELPFRGNRFSLVVLIPKEIHGFQQMATSMDATRLQHVMNDMQMIRVGLKLPKFRVESTINLNDVMAKLGAGNIFSEAADFSGITHVEKLHVNKAIHKAFLEVDERGAEAAAATGIEMMPMCLPPPPELHVTVDRPFLTWIWDKTTQTVLFMSSVCDPHSFD
jgi:serpin B